MATIPEQKLCEASHLEGGLSEADLLAVGALEASVLWVEVELELTVF
jgi:hypothetical protein